MLDLNVTVCRKQQPGFKERVAERESALFNATAHLARFSVHEDLQNSKQEGLRLTKRSTSYPPDNAMKYYPSLPTREYDQVTLQHIP